MIADHFALPSFMNLDERYPSGAVAHLAQALWFWRLRQASRATLLEWFPKPERSLRLCVIGALSYDELLA